MRGEKKLASHRMFYFTALCFTILQGGDFETKSQFSAL